MRRCRSWPRDWAPITTIFSKSAQAILTTDKVEKTAFARLEKDGKEVRIAALCKGSGMIHPQLVPHATMLVYILTDAVIEPEAAQAVSAGCHGGELQPHLGGRGHVDERYGAAAGFGREWRRGRAAEHDFAAALTEVCTSLARQIVADGEGVTHVVELRIAGAASDADALRVAKAIAHSPLVKTAWAGCDPNWGRLVAAIGYSGAQIDPERIDIWFGDLRICRNGARAAEFDEASAHAFLKQPEYAIRIQLNQGKGQCVFWTTDLTQEYVHINADYST